MPVLIMTLSCPIDEPTIAGPISFAILRTASCWKFHLGQRSTPIFKSGGTSSSTWPIPPTNTPTASATTGCSKYGDSHAANTIITTFNSTELNAGNANF